MFLIVRLFTICTYSTNTFIQIPQSAISLKPNEPQAWILNGRCDAYFSELVTAYSEIKENIFVSNEKLAKLNKVRNQLLEAKDFVAAIFFDLDIKRLHASRIDMENRISIINDRLRLMQPFINARQPPRNLLQEVRRAVESNDDDVMVDLLSIYDEDTSRHTIVFFKILSGKADIIQIFTNMS